MGVSHPTLVVEGLSSPLEPTEYSEVWGDEGLAVHFRVKVSAALGGEIRQHWVATRAGRTYFDVTRSGLDKVPRVMRFGQGLWSDHGDFEKHELVLVDSTHDDDGPQARWPGGPEEQKETRLVLGLAEQMKLLVDLLVQRGLLSRDEAESTLKITPQRLHEGLLELRRVTDLDEWKKTGE